MAARRDAIVIGGGVAGSSCAILLAQAGWSVALAERQDFPRRKVCGECIAASNLALFDALGIGADVRALAGPPLRRVAWCSGETTIEADLPALPPPRRATLAATHYSYGRALGREHLDTLLLARARAAGAHVLQPCTVKAVEWQADRFHCSVVSADGAKTVLEAPLVIDAHGSWERDPAHAGARPAPRAADLFAFKANFSCARLDPGVLPVLAFEGGYGGMVQGDHGLLTIACCVRRDRLQRWRDACPGIAAGEVVQQFLQQDIAAVRRALAPARREGAWLAVGPIRPRIGNAQPAPSRYAVGNAAGEAHPILGEGISMAVQSAFLLCERLVSRDRDAITGYARAWRRAFATRIRLAALCAHVAMHPLATRATLPLLQAWPSLLALSARIGGKTRCAVDAGRAFARAKD